MGSKCPDRGSTSSNHSQNLFDAAAEKALTEAGRLFTLHPTRHNVKLCLCWPSL